jgi:hypothetical protein
LHIKWIEIHLPVCVSVGTHTGLAQGITQETETAKIEDAGCPSWPSCCSLRKKPPSANEALDQTTITDSHPQRLAGWAIYQDHFPHPILLGSFRSLSEAKSVAADYLRHQQGR